MLDTRGIGEVSRTLIGGTLLGLISAGLIAAWAWANDRPECDGEMFACAGEALLVVLLGVPAAVLVAWLGLRALRATNAALEVVLTLLVGVTLPSLVDPPLWVWPLGLGAVGCFVIALLERPTR